MRLLPCLLLLASCSAEPDAYNANGVGIDPGSSGLDVEVAAAVAWYQEQGFDIHVGPGVVVTWAYGGGDEWHPLGWFQEFDHGQRAEIGLVETWDWWFESRGDECNGWSVDTVLRHEMGHALGLWHSDDPRDIMHPGFAPCDSVYSYQLLNKEPWKPPAQP